MSVRVRFAGWHKGLIVSMARLNIGLRRAKLLCQVPTKERLDLIAEGLPIILESSLGFWRASAQLPDNPREAQVLEGFAEEEAAKILILMDAVRCPLKLIPEKIGVIVANFYDHLARLIYAEAQGWKPMHVSQLREYVDLERKAHYLEGCVGEYIVPNSNVTMRESLLYADIEAYEDGVPRWNKPTSYVSGLPRFTPTALRVAEALSALGAFSRRGLNATADIWGQLEFRDKQTFADAERLTQQLLKRLVEEGLPSEAATDDDVRALYGSWQMPMYHLDFKSIDVPLAELLEERDAIMWAETGYYY
jgi:hypothetical protein